MAVDRVRPAAMADLPVIEALWKESAAAKRTEATPDRAELAQQIRRNYHVVGESAGRIVADRTTHFFDKPVGWQMNVVIFTADADAERALLRDSTREANENADVKLLHFWRGRGDTVGIDDLGFTIGQSFLRMDRPNMEKIDGGVMPKGFHLTSYADGRYPDEAWRETYDAAFAKEWGFIPLSKETWERFYTSTGFDPSLFVMAVADDGTPAGIVLCRIKTYQDDRRQPIGLVEVVATMPAHREKHVATELMTLALRRLRYRGAASASVRVETTNRSKGIYGRLGFAETYQEDAWVYRPKGGLADAPAAGSGD